MCWSHFHLQALEYRQCSRRTPQKLVCTGRQWSARLGRRPWRCRCGLPYWWPPVLADAVAVRRGGVRPCGWCTGWRSLPLASVRRAGGRSVAGVRPWPWWPFSWPLAAFRPSAGPLVRRGPFVAAGGPFGPCVLAFHLVVFRRRLWPVAAGVRCWSLRALCAPSAVAVAVSLAVLAGVAGVGVIAPCRGPWSVSLASLAAVWLACWCHCAVPWWAVCRGPSVRAGVRRGRSLAVSVRPCWCAGVRSVAGVRLLPCSVAVAALSGRRWCWCPSLVLAARVGLVLGLADWLAVWALPVAGGGGWRCLRLRWCLPCQRTSARGWLAVGRVRCFPWWWRPLALLVVLAGVAPAAAVAARLIKGPTPAAAVAALLVVCVTCLRWRRRRWRRRSRPCASRTTCGGRRSACRRCGILKRRNTGWR